MELEKNRVREKSFLGVLVFEHPYWLSSNNTEFNAEYENTCPFPYHIGNSIPTFRDMYLYVIARKKNFYNFLYKIYDIHVYQICKIQQQ